MTTALHPALVQAKQADILRSTERRRPLHQLLEQRRARKPRREDGPASADREKIPWTWRPGSPARG